MDASCDGSSEPLGAIRAPAPTCGRSERREVAVAVPADDSLVLDLSGAVRADLHIGFLVDRTFSRDCMFPRIRGQWDLRTAQGHEILFGAGSLSTSCHPRPCLISLQQASAEAPNSCLRYGPVGCYPAPEAI